MTLVDFEILSKFKEISRRLLELQKEVLSNTKISVAEFKMMNVLDVNEKFSQTNLSDFCGIDKPAISRLINKMTEQNLVERKIDNTDRRVTYISLSNTGRKLLEKLREDFLSSYEKYFNRISENDKNTFIELLNRTLNKEEIC